MSLAKTVEQSIKQRREHVLDALYHRRKGERKAVRASMNLSKLEKMNQQYFLGDPPF